MTKRREAEQKKATQQKIAKDPLAYRLIELTKTPCGARKLYIRAGYAAPQGPSIDELIARGDVIEPEEVNGWFSDLKIDASPEEVAELTRNLNIMRVTDHAEVVRPNPPEVDRVAAALETITRDVPVLLAALKSSLDNAGSKSDPRTIEKSRDLSQCLADLLVVSHATRKHSSMLPRTDKTDRRSYWHRDVDFLMFFIENISARLRKPIALENDDGRGVAFIVKALQRTGSRPAASASAVARAIERRRQRELPVYPEPQTPKGGHKVF